MMMTACGHPGDGLLNGFHYGSTVAELPTYQSSAAATPQGIPEKTH